MRFHSWCPPEAAFTAEAEVGFYLRPEPGMWNVINPDSAMEKRLHAETERMISACGNHPSFALFSPSNEPGGQWKQTTLKWVANFRAEDQRRLHTVGTGWPLIETPGPLHGAVDFLAVHRFDRHSLMRGAGAWFGGDYSRAMMGVDVSNIAHETGQWCGYPDVAQIAKFTGYLRAGNFEIFRDSLAAHGMRERDADFARASGLFHLACYKEEIEANLRTKELRDFQLLDLHDYLGQGAALVGLLDTFWEEKSFAHAAQFRRFCSETVPLARLSKRVFTAADTFDVPVELSHFGAVVDARGEGPARDIAIGNGTALGPGALDPGKLVAPAAYRLVVGLRDTSAENDWNFWVRPTPTKNSSLTSNEQVTRRGTKPSRFSPQAKKFSSHHARPSSTGRVRRSVARLFFWNRLMGPGRDRMLGLWCDPKHRALAQFPTEGWGDWQWIDIVADARAINIDRLPRALKPIVQPIDDWNRNYKLALVFECAVGSGKLLLTSIDLERDLATRPVARQLRASLLAYMTDETFAPKVAVASAEVRSLFFDTRIMAKLGATAIGAGRPSALFDGDPGTFWMSGRPRPDQLGLGPPRPDAPGFDNRSSPGHPHAFQIKFPQPVAMSGLIIMPRQNRREHLGDVRGFAIAASDDAGATWRVVSRGELESSFEPKTVRFDAVVTTAHSKFTALSGYGEEPAASLAEIAVIYAGPKLPEDANADGAVIYQRGPSATPEIEEGAAPRP